jgi:hypothetical protein
MTFIELAHAQVGLAFSIVGLVLVVPSTFLFKQYFRFFDHLQLTLLYWMALAPSYDLFASHLTDSWAYFVPNFLKFCTFGDLVCQLGFALSFTICLLGVILLLWLIVTLEKCRKPDLRFEPVYSTFKGFFRWTYIALAYYSLTHLITDLKNGTRNDFLSSIVVLAWTAVFPIIQLIFYKVIQTENDEIWVKWFEFLGYYRHLSIVIIFVLGQHVETNTTLAKYFVYGPLVIYAVLYLWKGIFMYNIFERIIYGIGEAAAITIYSFILFAPDSLKQYEIDFLGLALILFVDLIVLTVRMIGWLVYGKTSTDRVNPEEVKVETKKGNKSFEVIDINEDFQIKKKNKYDSSEDLQNSRDDLISPKKSGKVTGRKR